MVINAACFIDVPVGDSIPALILVSPFKGAGMMFWGTVLFVEFFIVGFGFGLMFETDGDDGDDGDGIMVGLFVVFEF